MTTTLGRKIIYWNAGLVVGLVLLGGVAVVGLGVLGFDVRVALEEYRDREAVERVKLRLAAARFATRPATAEGAVDELEDAIGEVSELIAAQGTHGSRPGEARERAEAEAVRGHIEAAAEFLRGGREDDDSVRRAHAAMGDALAGLERLGDEMEQTVGVTYESARTGVRRATIGVGLLAAVIATGGVLVSVRQYRSVMGPLLRLREAAGEMARGRLERRVEESGDEEYRRLAADFNHMAGELEGLYRELERKVAEKGAQLARSERLASVGFLAAGVAHEINNPLSIISGYAELSLKRMGRIDGAGGPPSPEVVRALEVIREEAFRCKEITGKLLELARGGTTERREVLAVEKLAAEVAELVKGLGRYEGRRVVLRFPAGQTLAVVGNATELKQVLLNLTVNGLEAVAAGTGQVVIEGARQDGTVRVVVRDNGKGMTPDVLAHVFEPFFTEKRGAGEPGTGLGLSISHAIVEGHAGTIRAESPGPGKGSAFTVELPAAGHENPTTATER